MTTAEQVIEEIRESRRKMSADCGHDPARCVAYLKEFNDKYSAEVKAYRDSRDRTPGKTSKASAAERMMDRHDETLRKLAE